MPEQTSVKSDKAPATSPRDEAQRCATCGGKQDNDHMLRADHAFLPPPSAPVEGRRWTLWREANQEYAVPIAGPLVNKDERVVVIDAAYHDAQMAKLRSVTAEWRRLSDESKRHLECVAELRQAKLKFQFERMVLTTAAERLRCALAAPAETPKEGPKK